MRYGFTAAIVASVSCLARRKSRPTASDGIATYPAGSRSAQTWTNLLATFGVESATPVEVTLL
jgi:hypothetical protein